MNQQVYSLVLSMGLALIAAATPGCAIERPIVEEPPPFPSFSSEGSEEIVEVPYQAKTPTYKDGPIPTEISPSVSESPAAKNSELIARPAITTKNASAPNSEVEPFYDPFEDQNLEEPNDPWESFNTKVFTFNKKLDQHILKPFATGYDWLMPDPLEKGISNAFHNIGVLPRFVNSLLQTKYKGAGLELGRFLINSTLGVAGLFDAAETLFDLDAPDIEDTGQTLGFYGANPGPYLVLPFLTPFTTRDAIGSLGDLALDPVNYLFPFGATVGMRGGNITNERSRNLELFQGVEDSTVDLYGAVRDAYLQKRAKAIME